MRQARAAVAIAEQGSTLIAVDSLCEALDVGLAAPCDPLLLEQLASCMEPTARRQQQALFETLAGSIDNPARFGLWGKRATSLAERMCKTWLLLLEKAPHDAQSAMLVCACHWLTRNLLLSAMAGDEAPAPPWRLLLAHLRGKNANLPAAAHISEAVRLALAELMLCNLALRRMQMPAQCFMAGKLLTELAPLLLLDNAYHRDTPCILLVDNRGLPQRLEGWQMPDEDGLSLFCGLHQVRRALHDRRCRMDAGQPLFPDEPVPADRQRVLQRAALDHLHAALSVVPDERFAGPGAQRFTLAAFDFMRIRVVLANPGKQAPKAEALIREVEVLNVSDDGIDLLLDADNDCARVNALLALYRDGEWWICVVRRLLREQDGRLFAGMRLLTRHALAARFLLLDSAERNVLGHVIFWPDARAGRGHILAAHLLLDIGATYTLDLERHEHAVLIERAVDAGHGFNHYSISFID